MVYKTPVFHTLGLALKSHPDDGTLMCSDRFRITIGHDKAFSGAFACTLYEYGADLRYVGSSGCSKQLDTKQRPEGANKGSAIIRSGQHDPTTTDVLLRFSAKVCPPT